MPHRSGEALVYWRAARDFRLKLAAGQDTSDEEDDLAVIAANSENPRIVRDARKLTDLAIKRSVV
jgi:hypothetical protein